MASVWGRSAKTGLSLVGLVAATMGVANAQANPPSDEAQEATALETVVVTAEKRSEDLQQVPITVHALDSRALDDLQVKNSDDLAKVVPGLEFVHANSAAAPYLRGIGNFSGTPGNEPAVATYVDDVYRPSPLASNFLLSNVERIEVLAGPQGTLFGRNAAGGVINIVTKTPSQTPSADLSVGYGNYDTFTAGFYGTAGVTDNLAADISLGYWNQGAGWGKNLAPGAFYGADTYLNHEYTGRTKWLYTPTSRAKITFVADYDRVQLDSGSTAAILQGTKAINGATHIGGYYDTYINRPTYAISTQYGLSMRADYDFGWAQAASISSYRRDGSRPCNDVDGGGGGVNFFVACLNLGETTTTQEFQVLSPSDSVIQWVGGLFLFWDKATDGAHYEGVSAPAPTYPDGIRLLNGVQNTRSWAPYGQATAPIFGDDTHIAVGLRYTSDIRGFHFRQYNTLGTTTSQAAAEASSSKLTYKAAIDHNFTDQVLGFASYSRGFKSGNFNLTSAASATKPEVVDNYEIGVKSEWFDDRLRVNASFFYSQFKDLVIQELLAQGLVQLNAGAATFKGIDLDLTAVPIANLTLQAAVSYVDPKITAFDNAQVYTPCTSPAIKGCTVALDGVSYSGGGYYNVLVPSLAGNQVAYAEKFTARFSAQYRILLDDGYVDLNGAVSHHSGAFYDSGNTTRQSPYNVLDASITWRPKSGVWDVEFWGKNITGTQYAVQISPVSYAYTYSPAAPATFGFDVGVHL